MSPTLSALNEVFCGRQADPATLDREHDRPGWVAAVYVLFGGPEGDPELLLMKRSGEVRHHRNEWAFPGGVSEPADETLRHTALRETVRGTGRRSLRHLPLGRPGPCEHANRVRGVAVRREAGVPGVDVVVQARGRRGHHTSPWRNYPGRNRAERFR